MKNNKKDVNKNMIIIHIDYAPKGVDLSKLGEQNHISIKELISKEALEKDYLNDEKLREWIIQQVLLFE